MSAFSERLSCNADLRQSGGGAQTPFGLLLSLFINVTQAVQWTVIGFGKNSFILVWRQQFISYCKHKESQEMQIRLGIFRENKTA